MSGSEQISRLLRPLKETDWRPYAGVLAVLPVGWLLDALPGIRVGLTESLGFAAAAALAVRYALGRRR